MIEIMYCYECKKEIGYREVIDEDGVIEYCNDCGRKKQ